MQVSALKAANKLFTNDRTAISLRRTLLIPLDACTAAPSREVIERIELDGDRLHLHCRPLFRPRAAMPVLSGASTPVRSSLDLAREDAAKQRARPRDTVSEYLRTTNVLYHDALIDLSTPAGSRPSTPGPSERPPSPPRPPPPFVQRTFVLTRMPSAKGAPASLIPALDDLAIDPPIRKAKSSPPIVSPSVRVRSPPSPIALATSGSGGWAAADDSELAMAADWLRVRRGATVAAAGSARRKALPVDWTKRD